MCVVSGDDVLNIIVFFVFFPLHRQERYSLPIYSMLRRYIGVEPYGTPTLFLTSTE